MSGGEPCVCGHTIEEHGHDPRYPGATSCDECSCVFYEADYDAKGDQDENHNQRTA